MTHKLLFFCCQENIKVIIVSYKGTHYTHKDATEWLPVKQRAGQQAGETHADKRQEVYIHP